MMMKRTVSFLFALMLLFVVAAYPAFIKAVVRPKETPVTQETAA